MPRFGVNYDEVWKEVSSAEFVNRAPSSEHDQDSVRRLANLIQEALQILQNSAHLSPAKIKDLKAMFHRLEAQLTRESALARKVDPAVPRFTAR